MDNEIEGVQFNRKRMNSTISNSSGGRSMDTPSKFGDQVIFQNSIREIILDYYDITLEKVQKAK